MSRLTDPAARPASPAAVEIERLSHRFGRTEALHDVSLAIPSGSVYALLGANGAGKSTLVQAAVGLRPVQRGHVRVRGTPVERLTSAQRTRIGYVAESQQLPGDLTLAQYERWLAPLYPTWDQALAHSLHTRFHLDPSQRLRNLSRGQRMQAALLCALAPRPDVLFMDEPFAGLDAAIKDDLVRGVLELSGREGWTVVIASHDLPELDLLVDHVGFLRDGRLLFSDPMDAVRARFRWLDVQLATRDAALPRPLPATWVHAEISGHRVRALARAPDEEALRAEAAALFPGATRIASDAASLTDLFIGLTREGRAPLTSAEVR